MKEVLKSMVLREASRLAPTEHLVLTHVPLVFIFHLVCELEQKSIFSRQRETSASVPHGRAPEQAGVSPRL